MHQKVMECLSKVNARLVTARSEWRLSGAEYAEAYQVFKEAALKLLDDESAVPVPFTVPVAKALLALSDGNRRLIRSSVAKLINDILTGRWDVGDSVAIINIKGFTKNGHHRAQALIEASQRGALPVALRIMLRMGASEGTEFATDRGRQRDAAGVLHFDDGLREIRGEADPVESYELQTLIAMLRFGKSVTGIVPNALSDSDKGQFIIALQEELDFLKKVKLLPPKRGVAQPIIAAFGRAYRYFAEKNMLTDLELVASIVINGSASAFDNPSDRPEIRRMASMLAERLRENTKESKSKKKASGGAQLGKWQFQLTCNALNHILNKTTVQSLSTSKEDFFPLSDEVAAPAKDKSVLPVKKSIDVLDPNFWHHLREVFEELGEGVYQNDDVSSRLALRLRMGQSSVQKRLRDFFGAKNIRQIGDFSVQALIEDDGDTERKTRQRRSRLDTFKVVHCPIPFLFKFE